jgi:hypothetical protein
MQPVSPSPGESGYFSAPGESLDPRLFNGERFRPEVRQWILNTLYHFWSQRYKDPQSWSTVWVAGSGISYQWAAGRGNGDLDILIGVDYDDFFDANPRFAGLSEDDIASTFNQEFHEFLWPTTEHTQISEGKPVNPIGTNDIFEVTFYVNPGATDIRNINPYAAYNLSDDSWTVRPPTGDAFQHPKEFYDSAANEVDTANRIVSQYNSYATQAKTLNPGSPGWHNTMRQVDLLASQAASMFDAIHLGRKQAFSQGGSGYGDYYNFRWQYHKQHGTVQALHEVAEAHKKAHDEFNANVYGGAIDGADVVLRRAALWNAGTR